MSERNGKYYTLAIFHNDEWTPQFGDHDRNVVKQEELDTYRRDHKAKDCTIFWTWYSEGQAAIDEQIRRLNQANK